MRCGVAVSKSTAIKLLANKSIFISLKVAIVIIAYTFNTAVLELKVFNYWVQRNEKNAEKTNYSQFFAEKPHEYA